METNSFEIWALVPNGSYITTTYIASNANNWQPNDKDFLLVLDETDGFYKISLSISEEDFEFKFTGGSWETVETNSAGNAIENRRLAHISEGSRFIFQIENWQDSFQRNEEKLSQINVSVWHESLFMPSLNRHRRIWVYLPPNYENSQEKYPVMYMHDAQNLFLASDSPYQKWEVGRTLNKIYQETSWACIVIGIEHGEEHRLAEYSVYPNPNHGGGEGDSYLKFIIDTLKPAVDSHFRTLPDAQHTAMIGSSMGGLISIFAALKYGNIFGNVAAFSPSLWWSDDIYALAASMPYHFVHKMVLLGGEKESDEMVPDLMAMYHTLADNGYYEDKIKLDFYQDGTHTESFWGREFEKAIRWLMIEAGNENVNPIKTPIEIINYDEQSRSVIINSPFLKVELLNIYGKVIASLENSNAGKIEIPSHWKGLHALKCFLHNQRIEFKKIIF